MGKGRCVLPENRKYFTSTTILVYLSNSEVESSFIVEYLSLNSDIVAFTVCWLVIMAFNLCCGLITLILYSELCLLMILTVVVISYHPLRMKYCTIFIGYPSDNSVGAQLNIDNPYLPCFK